MLRIWLFVFAAVALALPGVAEATCDEVQAILSNPLQCGRNAPWTFQCRAVPAANGNPLQTDIMQYGVADFGSIREWGLLSRKTCNACELASDMYAFAEIATGTVSTGCNSGCKYYLADGNSTSNGFGQSLMVGTWKPTGGMCVAGDLPIGGTGDDGEPESPPSVCGEGTCYDPEADSYCYSAGGATTCVSGATARGEGTAPGDTPTGGCASGDSTTICAGSPPPRPPPPPESPISDPASEINSSDRFTNTSVSSGGGAPTNSTVNVNVYGAGNTPTSSGQGAGDSGPAPPSSSPSPPGEGEDKGSASGGGDCGSPPVCSGDAPTCMVARQVWLSRCDAEQPNWTKVKPGDGDGYTVDEVNRDSVFTSTVVDGSKIDQTGWAGNSCPQLPVVTVFGNPWSMDQGFFCEWLAMLRPIFLLVAGFVAVRITASGGRA